MEGFKTNLKNTDILSKKLPLIQTYEAAVMAKISKNNMNINVSKLFAVTLLTPYRIVFNSLPYKRINENEND